MKRRYLIQNSEAVDKVLTNHWRVEKGEVAKEYFVDTKEEAREQFTIEVLQEPNPKLNVKGRFRIIPITVFRA